jgi:large subunit ribosomal protein L3
MKSIIGRKIGMTEVYAEDGTMYAVTVVEVLPNVITQKKTIEKDGYEALQVGYEDKKEKNVNKPMKGIYKKANVSPKQHLYELKGDELSNYEVGQEIKADIFQVGDVVDVIGHSKGRGYAGVIKRWHHKIGPKGHGSGYHRGQGSFANNGRCNNRVIPGKKMAGHMGNDSATVLNARVIAVDATKNYILVSGGVPGSKLSIVMIRSAVKGLKHPETIKPLLDRAAYDAAIAQKAAEEAAAKEAKKAEEKAKVEAAKKAAEEKKAAEQRAAAEAKKAEEAAPAEASAPSSEENK